LKSEIFNILNIKYYIFHLFGSNDIQFEKGHRSGMSASKIMSFFFLKCEKITTNKRILAKQLKALHFVAKCVRCFFGARVFDFFVVYVYILVAEKTSPPPSAATWAEVGAERQRRRQSSSM